MQEVIHRTKKELATEVAHLRQRVAELEAAERDRQKVEKVLKRTEQEKAVLFDSISEHVVYQDMKMRVLWTNRAAGDSVGADPQQLVGRHCYEVWQQGSKPCVGCPVAMARKSGRPQEAEMTSPDGRVWFVRGYPVRDKKGKVIGAVEVTLEITESKQAEEALRKSEEKYRTVVELSPDGIAIASKGRHVFANKSLAKIFGVSSPDDLLGKPLMDYIHPDYRKAVGRRIEQQTKRGELVPLIEEKMLRADGTVIHTEVTAAPLEYEGEQAVLAAIRDITERKRAEEELRESEERFRMVLESSVDNLYRRNLQTNTYDYISPSVERISGYSSEEMRSMSLESVVSMMHPADIERSKCVLEESMASDSGTCLLEYRFRHKDGQYRWLSDLFTVVRDAQGRPLYLVGNVRDITERKRADEALRASEERFRTIFEAARDFIFLKDRDSKFTAVNPAMEQIYGVPASRLIGKTAKVLFGKEMAVRFREQDVRILNGETIIEEHPSPLKGSTAIHHVIKVPMRNSAGEIIGLCGIGRDITERKQMEEALRESEERFRTIVEQAAEAILAHDLDGRVLLVNSLTCEYTGYSREELLSMNALDLDHKILEKDYKRKYWEKLQIGKYVKVEAIHMRKDGSSYPAEVYLVKIMFKSQPIILCLARDITERKKAEEQLRESEERFRALFEGAPDAIFLADPESGRILDANPAASHLLLRPHEEIVGLHQSQLHPSHMEGQIKEAFVDDIRQFKQGKELRSIESAVMRSDRSEVPVEILGHMVSINGRPVLQGTFRDITERKKAEEALKKSEEKYRLLSENIPVAVYSALPDEHSTNLFLSGQFLELTGYPIEHFFKDPKLWSSLLHPEDRDYVWEKVREHRHNKDHLEVEYRIITEDKKVKWVRDRAKPVLDEHGEIMRIDGFMEDITQRKQAENALRESEEKYRSLVESSEDSIYLVDRNCNYIFLNNRHLDRLGVQSNQIIGKGYNTFHSPEESEDFAKRIKTVFKTGKPQSYEYRSQRDNRYFIRTLSPVTSPDREINAITVISKDITERKRSEEALRESENRFRILVEHSVDAFILHDLDGRILDVNQHTCDSLGYTREELLGLYVYDIDQYVAPSKHMEVWEAMVPGEPITLEGVHKRKDGTTFPVEVRLGVFESGGRKLILGLVRDVTERKQAEEKLREREAFNYALFRYNPVETIVVDRGGRVTGFNLAKEKAGDRLPTIGDLMYKDYAGKHEIDMRAELMNCIRSGKREEFPERKYGDKYLNITISPFAQGAIIISEDITERKRTAEALRESEQFSFSLLNDSPNPIIVINPDTSIRYVNPALEKLTGFSAAELLGRKAPYPWWGDEIISETTIGLKRAMQQGSRRVEKHFRTKSGGHFWVEITSEPVMQDGKVQYLLTNWIDITERKRAEELLQRERDTFYSILERAPYGVMVLDAVGDHSFVNPEFTNITGYTREDIPTTQEWLHRAYPDQHYRNKVMKMWEYDSAQSKDEETFRKRFGRVFSRTFTVMCKDGANKEIEFRTSRLGDEAIIVMLSDATDRKRMHDLLETAAAEWRTTFDAISDAVCLLDSRGKIIRCNNAMLRLLGKPFSQITNHHCWEVMHGVSEAPHSCPIALAGKTNHRETEVLFKDSRWFNIAVDPLLDEDGNFLGGVHIMSDISDRMRIQNELQDSREQLRNLTVYLQSVREQERTNIAREIHDELAQALTALKMDLSWLSHKLPSEEGSLIEKTKSMNSLIDSTIHTVKRISAELRPGILDDLGLVAAIEWQAEEFQNRTGISCRVTVDPDDIAVDQDLATAIFRIFQETLTNVARHARARKVTVNLKKRTGKLTLRVKDNGIGITDEQISDSQSFGLIGMHERVIPWDGKISFKGIPDKGTTVTVSVGIDHGKKNGDKNSIGRSLA